MTASSTSSSPDQAAAGGEAPAVSQRWAGKYMSFKLGAEEYGIEILKVRELIGLLPVTRIPGAPAFVRGVINLRGRVIPVLDLRLKFGMPQVEATDQSVIIVIEHRVGEAALLMGVLVDEVIEVINISPAQIEPPPNFGVHCDATDFTLALGKVERRVICLLDIAKVLNASDQAAVGEVLKPT